MTNIYNVNSNWYIINCRSLPLEDGGSGNALHFHVDVHDVPQDSPLDDSIHAVSRLHFLINHLLIWNGQNFYK